MAKLIAIIYFLGFLHQFQAEDDGSPIIEVPGGKIKGQYRGNFYEFKAIPYAEPPIGDRRFEPPIPYTSKWDGIRDGTEFSTPCLQWDEFYPGHLHGDEDCLYLNVYTPSIESNSEIYPVIIYIHGGVFMYGGSHLIGPEYLLKNEKLILVTINYRLGPIGFLTTGDTEISGNMGLKDQQLAIKWVNENINLFRGNPQNIILSGFSAGAASVHFHLLSKGSQGLFTAAVSHSGTALCPWALMRNPLEKLEILGEYLKCPLDNTKLLKECLKRKDSKEIVKAMKYFQPFKYNPFRIFGPVIEDNNTKNAFISDALENIIINGNVAKVPWIVSFTEDEGGYNAAKLMAKDENGIELIEQLNEKWNEVGPHMLFGRFIPPDEFSAQSENLINLYLGNERFSAKTYRKFQNMLTDYYFLTGIERTLLLHLNYNDAPIYVYHYNKPLLGGACTLLSKRIDCDCGTTHGDDVFLIINNPKVLSHLYTEKDYEMSKYLCGIYDSFAKTGKPKFKDFHLPEMREFSGEFKMLRINAVDDYRAENVKRLVHQEPNDSILKLFSE